MTPDDELDHTPLAFGKYVGKTPDEISLQDASYILWLYEQCTPKMCSRLLYVACREDEAEDEVDYGQAPWNRD